jgi:hypothetical protein
MAETTPAAPAPSAPQATTQPTTPAQTHHAALQQRNGQGQFAGPVDPTKAQQPAATPPPEPKRWKVGDREVTDPDELYAIAAQREVDRRAYEEALSAREELARLKRQGARGLLTPEERRQLAIEEARRFKQEQEEAALPPEQRALLQQARRAQELEQRLKEREEAEANQKQEAARQVARQEAVAEVKAAMAATGLPESNGLARRVAYRMALNAKSGLRYPPEVVARQVKQEWLSEQKEAYSAMKPEDILSNVDVLFDKLEALDDEALLKRLPKLSERLRRLNLQALGAAPATPAQPQGTTPGTGALLPGGKEPQTPSEWEEYFRLRAKGKA